MIFELHLFDKRVMGVVLEKSAPERPTVVDNTGGDFEISERTFGFSPPAPEEDE